MTKRLGTAFDLEELPFLRVEITHLPTEQGGHRVPLISGSRCGCTWGQGRTEDGLLIVNDAQIELPDSDGIEPGGSAAGRLYPFHPELWDARQEGTSVAMRDGTHAFGVARIICWVNPTDENRC